jgi:hypothetical protein
VTDGAVALLTVMVVLLAIMAAVQIGMIVIALRASRQMTGAIEDLRRELRPIVEKVNRLADDAALVTSLAAIQVERVDAFLATAFRRVDATMSAMQGIVTGPVRQGAVFLAAIKAVMGLVRNWQSRTPEEREQEEDALFVG